MEKHKRREKKNMIQIHWIHNTYTHTALAHFYLFINWFFICNNQILIKNSFFKVCFCSWIHTFHYHFFYPIFCWFFLLTNFDKSYHQWNRAFYDGAFFLKASFGFYFFCCLKEPKYKLFIHFFPYQLIFWLCVFCVYSFSWAKIGVKLAYLL